MKCVVNFYCSSMAAQALSAGVPGSEGIFHRKHSDGAEKVTEFHVKSWSEPI